MFLYSIFFVSIKNIIINLLSIFIFKNLILFLLNFFRLIYTYLFEIMIILIFIIIYLFDFSFFKYL